MQKKFQHTFTKSKMNKDLDARLLSPDEYRDGTNVAVSRAEADDVGALENILGNSIVSKLNANSVFLEQIIGWHISEDKNKIYIFATDFQDNTPDQNGLFAPIGTVNTITVVNTISNTARIIVDGRFLNFSWNSPILDTVMLEDLLFFTDNRNQPRVINTVTAESNPNYYFNEDHVSLAKYYPHKPISLNTEYSAKAGLISNQLMTGMGWSTFNTWYSCFILEPGTVSPALQKALLGVNFVDDDVQQYGQPNIGLQGWVVDNEDFNFVNFKVAWVQKFVGQNNFPNNFEDGYLIAVDRELNQIANTNGNLTSSQTIYFSDENAKNVTTPWLQEDQTKLTIRTVGLGGATYTNDPGLNLEENAALSLYAFGTRSPWKYNSTQWQSTVFTMVNHFPKNTGSAKDCYCRIQSPRLDSNKYYVVIGVSSTNTSAHSFNISELTSLVGGQLVAVPSNEILAAGDIVTIHWPNKFYNQEFIGDATFLEDKFVRFAYRFQYDDGQYSLISPFSQATFIPKQRGHFLKKIGRLNSKGNDVNNYVDDEQISGENTIVDFMENQVSQVKLSIPCEYAINTLQNNLKVKSIDILYKESGQTTIKVVETIEIDDSSIIENNTNILEYVYNSKEPIKTLREAETTRVYDNVPIRAKTLSSSGNRIILGNFYDRPSSPNSLSYFVGTGRKLTPSEFPLVSNAGGPGIDLPAKLPNKYSTVSYPNHTLKQNRNYQVGIILQDRYGRSSDVILSSVTDDSFTLSQGVFANSPIEFKGSTLDNNYLNDVILPLTPTADVSEATVTRAGIVDWPGDSLKMLFTNVVPQKIPTLPGYPGIYEDPFTITTATTGTNADYIKVPKGGNNDNIAPGMKITWRNNEIDYFGYVWLFVGQSDNHFVFLKDEDGESLSTYPVIGDVVSFFYSSNPLGYYSYKIVVKQLQQEYFNVYLPSLLNGIPVIKPFTWGATTPTAYGVTFTSGSDIAVMGTIGTVTNVTFPLLEGMKVETAGGKTYYINNILNDTDFQLTSPASTPENNSICTFSTPANTGTLNVTTLLTDNSNKIPPDINETSPVQQNFSTSDVRLFPRYAFNGNFVAQPGDPYNATENSADPTFPRKVSATVQQVGNFENLYSRGSYNGLYQADNDPATAVIQNLLNIGQDSENVLPASEAESIPACFETSPTISNLEIFYETSTAGTIRDLNELVRDSLSIPGYFVNSKTSVPGTVTTGDDRVDKILVLESLDYTSGPTVATLQLVNQNGGLIKYYSATTSEIRMKDITISNPQYMDGSKILASGISFSKFSATDTDNRFKVELTSDFIGFNSGPSGNTNDIVFNVEFQYKFNEAQVTGNEIFNKVQIPLIISIDNVSPEPDVDFLNTGSTVFYIDNTFKIDPIGRNGSGDAINWGNEGGGDTTKTNATNGGNKNNTKQGANKNGIQYDLEIDPTNSGKFVSASSVENSGLFLQNSTDGSVLLATAGGSSITNTNIPARITATDGSGNGAKTTISSTILNIRSSA